MSVADPLDPAETVCRPENHHEEPDADRGRGRVFTIPNVISIGRLIGSVGLIGLAINGNEIAFLVTFGVLHLSDWIDGRLARWLNQHTDFGAWLDSVSDAVLYACLLTGCLILKWDVLQHEIAWLALPLLTYAVTVACGLLKFGRVPTYHTRNAKLCNWFVLFGAFSLLLDWSLWPMRIAAAWVTLTNVETTIMTFVLPQWKADVLSLRDALKLRRQSAVVSQNERTAQNERTTQYTE